ncbi:EAL domain-containing protein [Noviherbaspirillum sp. 1P10PC]|uniref:sensor domain-containing protein n=1 Tax=Noviherbaspirillum sp. 1P10PC TaxID=3132292 RepID=UPI0039A1C5D5
MAIDKANFVLAPAELLDLIFRKTLDAFIVSDSKNIVLVWSPYAETLFGWSAEEAIGHPLTALIIPPEHHTAHEEGVKRFLETGILKNINRRVEVFGMHKDGNLLPLEMTVIPVQLGNETLFTSSIRDNSERYQHEQMLRQQAALLHLSRDAIIVINMHDEIEFWSSGATAMFHYSEQEAIGCIYYDLLGVTCSPDRKAVKVLLEASEHWEAEVTCQARNGSTLSILSRYTLERDRNGTPFRILISNTDISARKAIKVQEMLLVESERRFQLLFEHHPDGVIHFNTDGRLTSVNQAFVQMSGYSADDMLSEQRPSLIAPEYMDLVNAGVAAAIRGTPQTVETVFLRKNGSRVDISATLIPNVANGQIIGVHALIQDNSVHRNHERQIHHMATHDSLTGLPNRYYLEDRLSHAIEHAKRTSAIVAVLFLDLNRFKIINDSLGHDKGDTLLGVVAERLKGAVREVDTVARIGGDEFVIVLENIHDRSHIKNVAYHILESIAKPVTVFGHTLLVTTSIGSSVYPDGGDDPAALIRQADLAMYEAKAVGQGVYKEYHSDMGTKAANRLLQENALRRALQEDQLVLHYQPRISLTTGMISCVEVLVRWNHPYEGLVLPSQFISMAEDMGLIDTLGTWVIQKACSQLSNWHRSGFAEMAMSVNISVRQLHSDVLYETLTNALANTGLDAATLELEITETAFMQDVGKARDILKKINGLGIKLSVDDFGTGYSSLSQLRTFPVDTLKIDQSFVENLPDDEDSATIVTATIAMARKLGLSVVAEGVTSIEQLRFLKDNFCDEAQGYLIAHPSQANEFELFMQSYQRLST